MPLVTGYSLPFKVVPVCDRPLSHLHVHSYTELKSLGHLLHAGLEGHAAKSHSSRLPCQPPKYLKAIIQSCSFFSSLYQNNPRALRCSPGAMISRSLSIQVTPPWTHLHLSLSFLKVNTPNGPPTSRNDLMAQSSLDQRHTCMLTTQYILLIF